MGIDVYFCFTIKICEQTLKLLMLKLKTTTVHHTTSNLNS